MFNIDEKFGHIRVTHFAKRANGPAPYHQIVLPDGVWLNVFENGQITVTSYDNDIAVTSVRNHRDGSGMSILITPKVRQADPEGDEAAHDEAEEHVEVLDLTTGGRS